MDASLVLVHSANFGQGTKSQDEFYIGFTALSFVWIFPLLKLILMFIFVFPSKILPPGTLKPQDKHLQTRVEYLIKILKQAAIEDKAEQLRKVSNLV